MINEYYKEKTYAENIFKNGFTSNNIKRELKVLAKYYKCEKDMLPKQREESLYEFCKQYRWFKKVTHYKLIDGAVNYSRKKDSLLIEIDSVNITEKEMKYIEELEIRSVEKKLLFSLLVIDKLNKERAIILNIPSNDKSFFGGGDWSYKKLINTMHNNLSHKKLHIMIGYLSDKGLLRIASKATIELLFVYEIDNDENVILQVNDFDRIGLYYDLYYGENRVKKCESCGVPIKKNNNRKSYCSKCSRERELEKYRKYNEKRINHF